MEQASARRVFRKWVFPMGGLALLLAFFGWIYGWGGGPINLLDFPVEDVARIRVSQSLRVAEVTEPEDVQALMDAVNAFRHSGNQVKSHPALLFGFAMGGTQLYEFHVFFKNGETFAFCFGLNKGGQDPSDTEVSYWIPDEPSSRFGSTCRGSMELIEELLDRGRPAFG